MTNFDVIRTVPDDKAAILLDNLVNAMTKECVHLIKQIAGEQSYDPIEISNFDIAEIRAGFRDFFMRENKTV